jgi:hypothetical protein
MKRKYRWLLEAHKENIQEIYDLYWEQITFFLPKIIDGVLFEKHTEVSKPKFKTKEIAEKFKITVYELHFLIAHHPLHKIKCKYCVDGVLMRSRSGESMSCRHTKECAKSGCEEGAKYTYCDEHSREEWDKHEIQQIKAAKERDIYNSQIFANDILPDNEYVLCLYEETQVLNKIRLTEISAVTFISEGECNFIARGVKFFTWLSSLQLQAAINRVIQGCDHD